MNINIRYEEIEKLIKEYYTLMIETKKNVTFKYKDAIRISKMHDKEKNVYLRVTADIVINNEIEGQMVEELLSESDVTKIIKRMLYLKNTEKLLSIKQNYDYESIESIDIAYRDKKIKRKKYKKSNNE